MRGYLLFISCAVALGACTSAVDSDDARMKASLVGGWRFEFQDDFERSVQGTFTLSNDGKFSGVEIVKSDDSSSELRLSGLWYVTDGLFKLNTQAVDGKTLGVQKQLFLTCKITEVTAQGFDCRDNLAQKTYTYIRTSNAS